MRKTALFASLLALLPMAAHSQQAPTTPGQKPDAPGDQVPPKAPGQTPPLSPPLTPIPQATPIVLPSGPKSDVDNRPLSADEAARLALRVQPSLRIAEAAVLAADGRLQVARSGLLPTVSLSSTYARAIEVSHGVFSFPAVTSSSATSTAASTTTVVSSPGVLSGLTNVVTLHQLIFDFNHTRDTVRQADAEEKAAKQGLTLAQLTLVYDVKQAYYTYVQDEELVKVQEANVKDTTQELDQATASLKVGLGAPADVVTATTNLGNATSALSQAQQTALIARINLALAIGIDARTPIVTSDAQEAVPPSTDVNALVIQALKARPDILQAQQTLRAAGFEFDAAKTVSAPSVDLSISGATRSNDQFFSENAGSLGLSSTWNFLDGGVTAGTKKEAQADIKTALANYQLAQQTAVSDVAQAYTNLVGAEQRVKISQAAVANAETGLKLAEGQFKAGVTIFVTVTTAETNLVQAQTDLVTAQVSVQLARAQLRHAIGAQ